MNSRKRPEELRSHRWYGVHDLRSFGHRSRTKQMGYVAEDYGGKPVVGIINTWSDINPCHTHFRQRAEEVKRGVWQAGGFPVELPAMSLSEPFQKPSTMFYRNFLAMETEELLRSHPIDGALLMGGCDKTTPALLMGAISMDLPALFVPAGPMLRGNWRGNALGSGSDVWKYWDEKRAGTIGEREWQEIEDGIARSPGHCMTMGTASTMTAVAEVLGMTLPGASSIPAADSGHPRMASLSGRTIVEMIWEDLKPSDILNDESYEDAVTAVMALGGSTNAVIHLIALAHRSGVSLDLARFDEISRRVPVLANIRPSGEYLMEDFYYAGGLRGLLSRLEVTLHLDRVTVGGRPTGETLTGVYNDEVIRLLDDPLQEEGGLAVLRGNLAPNGCVIKHSAADPALLRHTGPAVVFEGYNDLARRIDDPNLKVDARFRSRLEGGRSHRRSRHAGVGVAPHPQKAARTRSKGHGAYLRRPHERHCLRHLRAPRRSRVTRRRSARPREGGRRDRARCSQSAPGTQSGRETTISSPRRVESTPTTLRSRLRGYLRQARDPGQ